MTEKIPAQLKTADKKTIYITDEAKEHLLAHQDVIEFLEEAILKLEIPDGIIWIGVPVRLGRIIGASKLVQVEMILPKQKTFFAKRMAREFPSHVSLEKSGEPCDSVTLEIKYDKSEGKYFLVTAYIGRPCPDEPFHISDKSSNEFIESMNFWRQHALVYDKDIMGPVFEASWEIISGVDP